MSYSQSRLRKSLALVRIVTGLVFLSLGAFKVSSLTFAKFAFPDFLDAAARGTAVAWLRPMMISILNYGPGHVGVMLGFVELTIGVALLLGLAVRPACLLGILYSGWLLLATWNPGDGVAPMMQTADHQFRGMFPIMIFLLLGVGHAGETWGVGSIYHRHRLGRESTGDPADESQLVIHRWEPPLYDHYEVDDMEAAESEALDGNRRF